MARGESTGGTSSDAPMFAVMRANVSTCDSGADDNELRFQSNDRFGCANRLCGNCGDNNKRGGVDGSCSCGGGGGGGGEEDKGIKLEASESDNARASARSSSSNVSGERSRRRRLALNSAAVLARRAAPALRLRSRIPIASTEVEALAAEFCNRTSNSLLAWRRASTSWRTCFGANWRVAAHRFKCRVR